MWHARRIVGLRPSTAARYASGTSTVNLWEAPDGSFSIRENGGPEPFFPLTGPSSMVGASVTVLPTTTGLWAPTTRHYDSRVRVFNLLADNLAPFSEASEATRALIAARLESSPKWDRSNELPQFLRQAPNADIEVPIIVGYVHNAGALLALAALFWSLGWTRELIATRRRAKLRAAGLCPFCRYDLHGLKAAVCPECGKPTG